MGKSEEPSTETKTLMVLTGIWAGAGVGHGTVSKGHNLASMRHSLATCGAPQVLQRLCANSGRAGSGSEPGIDWNSGWLLPSDRTIPVSAGGLGEGGSASSP